MANFVFISPGALNLNDTQTQVLTLAKNSACRMCGNDHGVAKTAVAVTIQEPDQRHRDPLVRVAGVCDGCKAKFTEGEIVARIAG
ncbi:MAG: hypothetical protein ACLQG3_09635 [Terracidiphilus sp.]